MHIITSPDSTRKSYLHIRARLEYLGRLHTPRIGGDNGMDWGWDVGGNLGRRNDEYKSAWLSVHGIRGRAAPLSNLSVWSTYNN